MFVKNRTTLRAFGGKIIGFLEEDKDGNQQIRDFYGRIKGFYDKRQDKTRDFYGRIIGEGNLLMMLLNK